MYPNGFASIKRMNTYQAELAIHFSNVPVARERLVPLNRTSIRGTFAFVDEISFVSEIIKPHDHSWFSESWHEICSRVGESYDWSTWSCPRDEAVWRTLMAQRGTTKPRDRCYDSECHVEEDLSFKEEYVAGEWPTLRGGDKNRPGHTCREDVNKAFLAWSPVHTVDLVERERISLSDRFSEVLAHSKAVGCRFAVTEKGLIGTVPPMSVIGDRISIHRSCRVPVALRRVCHRHGNFATGKETWPTYQMVGSCYVLGLMDGEPGCGPTARMKLGARDTPLVDQEIVLV